MLRTLLWKRANLELSTGRPKFLTSYPPTKTIKVKGRNRFRVGGWAHGSWASPLSWGGSKGQYLDVQHGDCTLTQPTADQRGARAKQKRGGGERAATKKRARGRRKGASLALRAVAVVARVVVRPRALAAPASPGWAPAPGGVGGGGGGGGAPPEQRRHLDKNGSGAGGSRDTAQPGDSLRSRLTR